MKQLFAVTRARGPAWEDTKPLEEQAEWSAHGAFMDALAAERFVLLAGPLEGFKEALIIIRAGSSEEIDTRLAADPWTKRDLLRTTRIAPWTLRLGSLE